MKIIKSGVLAAFVVLALMVSHGIHAIPRGETLKDKALGAIRRPQIRSALAKPKMPKGKVEALVAKILALVKTHPVKSSTLGALWLGALGAAAYAMYGKMYRKTKENEKGGRKGADEKGRSPASGQDGQGGGPHEVMKKGGLFAPVAGKIEVTQEGTELMKITEDLISNKSFQKNFHSLVQSIKNLKAAVEKTCLDERALENLTRIMSYLGDFVGAKSAIDRFDHLTVAIRHAEAGAGGPKLNGLSELTNTIRGLLKSSLPEVLEDVTKALKKSESLSSLASSFNKFTGAVKKNIKDRSLKSWNLSIALCNLKNAAEEKDPENLLRSATFHLERIESSPLKKSSGALTAAIQKKIDELVKK